MRAEVKDEGASVADSNAGGTSAYVRRIVEFTGTPDDVEQAVQARMDRQGVVYAGDHTFAVVLEESGLR